MLCFALQKLPEVLDLGDIDLDRKRLRKQLQVVRIRKLYLAAIYNTSFFLKKKKEAKILLISIMSVIASVGFQKSFGPGSPEPPGVRPGTPASDGPPEDFTIRHCYLCQWQEVCLCSFSFFLFKS